ncbi:clotting factor G beta subunit-like [Tachypleus tridentatus]|uniref:clotting factor G beta subunit-like n=1 Tax=Tachypleus tridentatus TaxID=6853 RepID=UPI003FD5E61F
MAAQKPSELLVKAGAHNLLTTGTDFQVSEVIVHQDYKSGLAYHDIALLKLSVDVTYNDIIKPICLPIGRFAYQDFDGRVATIVGWGDTSYGGSSSNVIQEVKLPIVNFRECDIAYRQVLKQNLPYGITDRVICAGYKEGGKDACQGDSGGPLMLQDLGTGSWILAGIVSFGYQCARPNFPGVYTRVSSYINWISANAI